MTFIDGLIGRPEPAPRRRPRQHTNLAPRTATYKPVPADMPRRHHPQQHRALDLSAAPVNPPADTTTPLKPAPRHLDISAEAAKFVGGILPPRRPQPPAAPVQAEPAAPTPAAPDSPQTPFAAPAPPAPEPQTASQSAPPAVPTPRRAAKPSAPVWLSVLQYLVITVAALAGAFNATAGQILVGIYALYVLIRRPGSRLSFGAALFILITIPLFQALGRGGIAENAAIYVYELLVIGTISALFELRKTADTPN